MSIRRLSPVVLLFALSPWACAAQDAPPAAPAGRAAAPMTAGERRDSLFDPALHVRTADVKVGMTGHGLSVFRGNEIERFEVEVLAVLRRSEQIGTNVVLIRCSGANLEHTGPIAGMSGSPIYLRCEDGRDRLLGAFAFGWASLKDPLAGVQPIEAMLEMETTPPPEAPMARAAAADPRFDVVEAGAVAKLARGQSGRPMGQITGGLAPPLPAGPLLPLSLPLAASGFDPAVTRALAEALGTSALVPLAGAAGAQGQDIAQELAPGAPLAIPVLVGDMNLAAIGTCTTIIGDRVYGLGHPLLGEGRSGLPLAAGSVAAVIPTQILSFKIGSPGKILGTIATDAVAGVAGRTGAAPSMIPVTINVRRGGAPAEQYRFECARHPMLTMIGLAAAIQNATNLRGQPETGGATRWDVTLRYAGGRQLRLHDIASNEPSLAGLLMGLDGGGDGAVGAVLMPMQALDRNPFERPRLESLEADIELLPEGAVEIATLTGMNLPRTRFRAGETVAIDLVLRRFRGGQSIRRIELALPEDLPPGEYPLTVSESAAAIGADVQARPFAFEAKSFDELLAVFSHIQDFPADAVYVRLDRPEQVRIAVGRHEMPDLPNSRALLLAEGGRSDVKTYAPAVRQKVELPVVLTEGEAQATITVLPSGPTAEPRQHPGAATRGDGE